MERLFASVIICTYNREKYIYNVLKSIATGKCSNERYEIVLINNNCTDNTEKECDRFRSDFPSVSFRYYIEKEQGLSYARNRGIIESKGNLLVYVDDDAYVNDSYLQTYLDFFELHPEIEAAGGPILPEYETQEPDWVTTYTRQLITGKLYLGDKQKEFPSHAFPGGGNAAYRKSVFDKVGLFNVELGRKGDGLVGAEEKDIFDKMTTLNMRFFYLPTAILYHIIPPKKLTKEYFDKLTYSIGKSERIRTKNISNYKYLKRLIMEGIKWAASFVLCTYHTLALSPKKGFKLIQFRYNVTKGLLGF